MSIRSRVYHLCYSHFRDRETEARVKELAQSLAWLVSGRARAETQISWTPGYEAPPLWEGTGEGGAGVRRGLGGCRGSRHPAVAGGWGGLETERDDAGSGVAQLSESPLLCHLPRHQEQRGWGQRVAERRLRGDGAVPLSLGFGDPTGPRTRPVVGHVVLYSDSPVPQALWRQGPY